MLMRKFETFRNVPRNEFPSPQGETLDVTSDDFESSISSHANITELVYKG